MTFNLNVVIPPECQLKWPWAFYLGFCIRDGYDIADFVFGFTSLTIWMFALFPQIVQNYQTKSVESQSIWLWGLWSIGDVTNIIGCLLTKQIVSNTLLALFFCLSSVIILIQWFYYTYYFKRKSVYGSVKTVAKTTGVLGGALCFVNLAEDTLFSPYLLSMDGRRRLLHFTPRGRTVLGAALGWIMALIYIIARVPQMWKSVTTKEVKDLSKNMFIFTFLGNITQILSMVIKHVRELDVDYFKRNSPWMINAGLCAIQDLILVFLISRYGKRGQQNALELQALLSTKKEVYIAGSSYQATTATPKGSNVEVGSDCKV